jgi:mRNA-degrading endonuclease YafQ of YafQ-DinJ toxin-antitoxin module
MWCSETRTPFTDRSSGWYAWRVPMRGSKSNYGVTHRNPDEFWKVMGRLEEGYLNKVMAFLRDHLQVCPKDRHSGLKELSGTWRGYYQFEVSRSLGLRLIYVVDEDAREVRIEYFGTHPSWSRARDGQNL